MGIDYDLFWTLNPTSLEPFIKAFSMRTDYDDIMAWRAGMYIQRAIASSLSKNNPYPNKPMFGTQEVIMTEEQRQKVIQDRFLNHMKLLNKKFEKE